MIHVLINISQK